MNINTHTHLYTQDTHAFVSEMSDKVTALIKIQYTKFGKRLCDIREQTVCFFTVFLKNPIGTRESPDNLIFFPLYRYFRLYAGTALLRTKAVLEVRWQRLKKVHICVLLSIIGKENKYWCSRIRGHMGEFGSHFKNKCNPIKVNTIKSSAHCK